MKGIGSAKKIKDAGPANWDGGRIEFNPYNIVAKNDRDTYQKPESIRQRIEPTLQIKQLTLGSCQKLGLPKTLTEQVKNLASTSTYSKEVERARSEVSSHTKFVCKSKVKFRQLIQQLLIVCPRSEEYS